MTIGEKIAVLRAARGISQEQLAEALSVSRQSVSKWEMDQSIPQTKKIMQISDLLHISLDSLMRDEIRILGETDGQEEPEVIHRKYFGTDGFRGEAGLLAAGDLGGHALYEPRAALGVLVAGQGQAVHEGG